MEDKKLENMDITTENTAEVEEKQPAEILEETDKNASITANVNESSNLAESNESDDEENEDTDDEIEEVEKDAKKEAFKLTIPSYYDEIKDKLCAKRGRKLIYKPNEVVFEKTFKIIGLDKTNDEDIKVKDIIDAEIKEGLKLGYLDKFDGLKTSEIKEEYENDVVFELADQEFRKMGILCEGDELKVFVYDWDRVGFHNIGKLDKEDAKDALKYFADKDNFSFDLCGIITGGKAKRVEKDASGKIKITKEKGEPIGVELDVTIVKRKD